MADINIKAKELFEKGEIDIFIGYEKGTKRPRPFFASNVEEVDKLVFDDTCSGNLAVYLIRKDLVGGKRVGISASYYALKSISQLFDENQIQEDKLKIFTITDSNELRTFANITELKEYLKGTTPPAKVEDEELIKNIDAMTQQERWEFWSDEMSKCFKCYACRAACPMCYCTRCIVEVNRPQWIDPWASTLSNMEWQINRVMHMAGRCSDCGSCGAACPLGIPIHLLTHKMVENVKENFNTTSKDGNVLSTFKPEDKENFIR